MIEKRIYGHKAFLCLALGCLPLLFSQSASAKTASFYREANLIGGYSEEDAWVAESRTLRNSLGFEYFKKFSNEYGDFLTFDLQARFAYDSSERASEAWGVEIHDAWLEYKITLGKNARIGHFSPAFGLEPTTDTHGTLLQTLAMKDIGFKKDWGVSSRGYLGDFDYEMAAQIGSGMGLRQLGENYLLSARIGLPQKNDFSTGFSLLWGEVLRSEQMWTLPHPRLASDQSTRKKRIGWDMKYRRGPFLIKAEASFGQNKHKEVLGLLGEIDYTVPRHQQLEVQLQSNAFFKDLDRTKATDVEIVAGISYQWTPALAFRVAYFGDLHADREKDHRVLAQLYYFG